jgi:hypothetical protein
MSFAVEEVIVPPAIGPLTGISLSENPQRTHFVVSDPGVTPVSPSTMAFHETPSVV